MAGVNKVILVGNVGRDPEVRFTQNGDPVANIALATSESWKDKNTGERQEKTEWHNIVFFGRLAEIVKEYVSKGSMLFVEGKLVLSTYEQEGVKKYKTEIHAHEMKMLGGKPENAERQGQPARQERSGPPPTTRQQMQPQGQGRAGNSYQPTPVPQDAFDDDIPF